MSGFCRPGLAALFLLLGGWALSAQPVKIGYFGPDDPNHPLGGTIWLGAQKAVEEANAAGGYNGRPFQLIPGWDENPWSGGARSVIRMAYEDRVVAIIGSINGEATHLAEQIVAKALLPLVDPASTDRTVNAAFVPWMFSLMPDDRQLMKPLVGALDGRYVLLSSTGHDSRLMTAEFLAEADRRGRLPYRRIEFAPSSHRLAYHAGRAAELEADTIVVLAGITDSAAIVKELRKRKPDRKIYGGPALGRSRFLEDAGKAADGVRFPLPLGNSENSLPDFAAAHASDAVSMLVQAIRNSGLNRERIRDELARMTPWTGVTGTIQWDDLRRNQRTVKLGTISRGKVTALRP